VNTTFNLSQKLQAVQGRTGMAVRWTGWAAISVATAVVAIHSAVAGTVAPIALFTAIAAAGILLSGRLSRLDGSLFALSFGVACSCATAILYLYLDRFGVPYMSGGTDDATFDVDAVRVAQQVTSYDRAEVNWLSSYVYAHNSLGYIYFLSLIVRLGDALGGYDTLMPRIANCGFLAMSCVLIRRCGLLIGFDRDRATRCALWVALFPAMWFSAAHVFRDAITSWMLVTALFLALLMLQRRSGTWTVCLAAFAIATLCAAMAEFRTSYCVPICAMPITALTARLARVRAIKARHLAYGVLIMVPVLWAAWQTEAIQHAQEQVTRYQSAFFAAAEAGENTGLSARLFSLPMPVQIPARVAYATVTPLPVIYQQLEWNALAIGTVVQFFAAPFVLVGAVAARRDTRYLLVLLGFIVLFYSYVQGTFSFRHILAWFPFAVLLGSIGYSRIYGHRWKVWSSCAAILFLSGIAYLMLKDITIA